MKLTVQLASDTAVALADHAVRDLRPLPMAAEAILRRALGLPVPIPPDPSEQISTPDRPGTQEGSRHA